MALEYTRLWSDSPASYTERLGFPAHPGFWFGSMASAQQDSELQHSFGPQEIGFDFLPLELPEAGAAPLPIRPADPLPTFDLESDGPLPELTAVAAELESPPAKPAGPSPNRPAARGGTGRSTGEIWLDGHYIFCVCPDCRAPMTIRCWLMIADCWRLRRVDRAVRAARARGAAPAGRSRESRAARGGCSRAGAASAARSAAQAADGGTSPCSAPAKSRCRSGSGSAGSSRSGGAARYAATAAACASASPPGASSAAARAPAPLFRPLHPASASKVRRRLLLLLPANHSVAGSRRSARIRGSSIC